MGMYTELVLKCSLKDDLPQEVDAVIKFLFATGEQPVNPPENKPDHIFFSKPRWRLVGRGSSFYHHPGRVSSLIKGYLFSRSDIKNYDGEIEAFVDWIQPYIEERPGQCIGWEWYEEDVAPTLLFKK